MAKRKSTPSRKSAKRRSLPDTDSVRLESVTLDPLAEQAAMDEASGLGSRSGARQVPMTRQGLVMLLVSSLAYALSLPPFELWPLAFVAMTGWIYLAKQPPGKRESLWIWLAGFAHWAVTFHFLCLPHWAGIFGLILIAAYAAIYDVLFVKITRRLLRRGWPTLLAAPMVWCAGEVIRSTLFTGMPIGILGHALYRQPLLIQSADLAGEITVSAFLVTLSAVIANLVEPILSVSQADWAGKRNAQGTRARLVSVVVGINVLVLMVVYGWQSRLYYQLPKNSVEDQVTVALIQGSRDVQFGLTSEVAKRKSQESYQAHRDLTVKSRLAAPNLSAVVWPESMFPALDVMPLTDEVYQLDSAEWKKRMLPLEDLVQRQQMLPYQVLHSTGTGAGPDDRFMKGVAMIAGMGSYDVAADRDYNSAVYFDAFGNLRSRYSKVHLVPFGEFLPLGDVFPQLYELAPITRGLSKGPGVKQFEISGRSLVPTVCYESVIGWHIRSYLLQLQNGMTDVEETGGEEAKEAADSATESQFDALLNISNDGWFWGSSALDLHLASNVFRAVENRCQHLVASNTGISGEIAADGTIVQEGKKRTREFFLAEVPKRPVAWRPFWWTIGNLPWWICAGIVTIGCLLPVSAQRRLKDQLREESTEN